MGQRPLDDWIINRINQLRHDQHLSMGVIARRLQISRTAIRHHLMEPDKWREKKKPLALDQGLR